MADDTAKSTDDLPHSPGPAGGWGSMKGIASIYGETWASPGALDGLRRLNKPKGVMCVSCAWPKPANYSAFEFCENGAKATLWELTKDRCTPDFFSADGHTVTELREWSDHELEKSGRLTHPMKYDAASDRYVPIDWDDAFAQIGATLRDLPRDDVVFYASGHAGLEASYLYALLARAYGNNNLPQSSNMCHETTSVGLTKVIGSPVGTVTFDDLAETDCYFYFGQNPGTNSPRFLHNLKDLKDRGGKIVTFNPVIEQGLVSFIDPQNPLAMMTGKETIKVNGKPVKAPEATRLWRYHKPSGLITTTQDPAGRRTIFDELPKHLPRTVTVGRLDLTTEGLLLLTNDGQLARTLELPRNAFRRRYRARAHGRVTPDKIEALKNGGTRTSARLTSRAAGGCGDALADRAASEDPFCDSHLKPVSLLYDEATLWLELDSATGRRRCPMPKDHDPMRFSTIKQELASARRMAAAYGLIDAP